MSAPTLGEVVAWHRARSRPNPTLTWSSRTPMWCTCGVDLRGDFDNHLAAVITAHLAERLDQCRKEVRANHRWWGYDCTCGVEVNSPDGWAEHLFAVVREALGAVDR